ncbi:hypothetical protein O163_05505 [Caldanaerobacter subterraneus subsp. yonseiensis KB-1]|uniref:CRISPR system Cms protein Csm5 n=1 Tax=Caldanaerobacter subterraneus subsp. yonseiensis KB-1 TaxID=1388761 RepID=U5CQY2_CALSX|nr:type III-A CRISPR-associated RAMP protein Csm5 [Caldanaerobacter subterraneus]ERM92368.1 hypothetical protein O163_05505 [Caldanaerobacter subterraneus subsp. yonseiensis KB-1]
MKYTAKLTALSPVFVGDEKGHRSPLEFFKEGPLVYVLSEDKLPEILLMLKKVNHFMGYVMNSPSPSLYKYFETISDSEKNLIIKNATLRAVPAAASSVKNLRLHICDPVTLNPYIPASSIKGALRSALMHYFISDNSEELRKHISKISRQSRGTIKKEEAGKVLDFYYFQNNKIRGNVKARKGANTDLMRIIKISDAFSKQKDISGIVRVKVVSLNRDRGYHFSKIKGKEEEIEIFIEAIRPGSEFIFELEIDDFLDSVIEGKNKHRSMKEMLIEALHLKSEQLIQEEKEFFEKAGLSNVKDYLEVLKKEGVNLRIGWGSGLLGTTAALLLKENERRILRDKFFQSRNSYIFPQSRKVVVTENEEISGTLGWCRLELITK